MDLRQQTGRRPSPAFKSSFTVSSKCNKNVTRHSEAEEDENSKRREQPITDQKKRNQRKRRTRKQHTSQFAVDTTVSSLNIDFTFASPGKQKGNVFEKKDITTKKERRTSRATDNRREQTRVLFPERTIKVWSPDRLHLRHHVFTFTETCWPQDHLICPVAWE